MEQKKKGMQDIDVTKKPGVNELSDEILKDAAGGDRPRRSSWCPKCGTALHSNGFCPNCRVFP